MMIIVLTTVVVWFVALGLAVIWRVYSLDPMRQTKRQIRKLEHYHHSDWCTDIRELF